MENPWRIRCICSFEDDDGFTIQCERCDVWQHAVCMNIDPNHIPDEYICEECQPRPVDRKRAYEIQHARKLLEEKKSTPQRRRSGSTRGRGVAHGSTRLSHSHISKTATNNDSVFVHQSPARSSSTSTTSTRTSTLTGNRRRRSHAHSHSAERLLESNAGKESTPYRLEYVPIARNIMSAKAKQVLSTCRLKTVSSNSVSDCCSVVPVETQNFCASKFGLFATRDIKPKSLITEVMGDVYTFDEYKHEPRNQYQCIGVTKRCVFYNAETGLVVDARVRGSDARFARNSCQPTVGLTAVRVNNLHDEVHFFLVALSHIKAGTELTVDWNFDEHHPYHELLNETPNEHTLLRYDHWKALENLTSTILTMSDCAMTDYRDCVFVKILSLFQDCAALVPFTLSLPMGSLSTYNATRAEYLYRDSSNKPTSFKPTLPFFTQLPPTMSLKQKWIERYVNKREAQLAAAVEPMSMDSNNKLAVEQSVDKLVVSISADSPKERKRLPTSSSLAENATDGSHDSSESTEILPAANVKKMKANSPTLLPTEHLVGNTEHIAREPLKIEGPTKLEGMVSSPLAMHSMTSIPTLEDALDEKKPSPKALDAESPNPLSPLPLLATERDGDACVSPKKKRLSRTEKNKNSVPSIAQRTTSTHSMKPPVNHAPPTPPAASANLASTTSIPRSTPSLRITITDSPISAVPKPIDPTVTSPSMNHHFHAVHASSSKSIASTPTSAHVLSPLLSVDPLPTLPSALSPDTTKAEPSLSPQLPVHPSSDVVPATAATPASSNPKKLTLSEYRRRRQSLAKTAVTPKNVSPIEAPPSGLPTLSPTSSISVPTATVPPVSFSPIANMTDPFPAETATACKVNAPLPPSTQSNAPPRMSDTEEVSDSHWSSNSSNVCATSKV
ncbi:histone lysine methyltransferase Set3 [Schizosaccharomyces japonicus yFS275]|uniref:Histone lysine methyltransferase Set3 n=1 Tax=Schizosaccharomyces japonicus (strain yFS275 / FY16936) TaxID=402676 RepID=B6K6Q7_SCHJY|nr:histone lysine methyltransferase Set3 [Schizosaccharomyces japonicus yFS275]EEB09211.2 histone lysine methyltransferase Set3 [Schizosaccharomyces japonicus yFS275]